MKQDFLKNFPMMDLVVVGQLLFFTTFMCALFWVFRNGSKSFYEKLAALPLDEKEPSQ